MLQKFIPLFVLLFFAVTAFIFRDSLGSLMGLQPSVAEQAGAMVSEGQAYVRDDSTAADYAKALPLFQAAAKLDYAPAERQLGIIYDKGLGLPKSPQAALKWYTLAAEQGDGFAQFSILNLFLGAEIDMPFEELVKWTALCVNSNAEKVVRDGCQMALGKLNEMSTPAPEMAEKFAEGKRRASSWQPRQQGSVEPQL